MKIIINALMTVFTITIVSAVLNGISARKNKYQKSTEQFVVQGDPGGIIFCAIGIVFFGICTYGSFIAPSENGGNLWPFFAFFALAITFVELALLKKIKVNGTDIKVSQLLPLKMKHYSFNEITAYTIDAKGVHVYAGSNKLFSFDDDMIGASNMILKMEDAGIQNKIIDNEGCYRINTVKKSWIIKNNGSIFAMGIIFGFLFIATSAGFGYQKYKEAGINEAITTVLGLLIMFVILMAITIPLMTVKSYKNIKQAERILGINFDEEMERIGATSFNFINDQWFISEVFSTVSLVRKDCIEKVISCEKIDNQAGDHFKIKIKTRSGETVTILTFDSYGFSEWIQPEVYRTS